MQQPYQPVTSHHQVSLIPIEQIVLRQEQPFAGDDGASIRQLAASIRRDGLIQPITVHPRTDGRYTIVSGNRRLLACRMCGYSHIEAVVLPGDPQSDAVRQMMDMLFSGAMHYLDEAEAIHRLCVVGNMSTAVLARRLGVPEGAIHQRLQLMQLSAPLRSLIQNHHMPSQVAYALLTVPDEDTRMSIARQAARQHLSVVDVDLLISSAIRRTQDAASTQPVPTTNSEPDAPKQESPALQPLSAVYQEQISQKDVPSDTAAPCAQQTETALDNDTKPIDDTSAEAAHGRTISVMRDERLYLNAIRALVNQMQDAGVNAELDEISYGSRVELTIHMPMTRHRRAEKYHMTAAQSMQSAQIPG